MFRPGAGIAEVRVTSDRAWANPSRRRARECAGIGPSEPEMGTIWAQARRARPIHVRSTRTAVRRDVQPRRSARPRSPRADGYTMMTFTPHRHLRQGLHDHAGVVAKCLLTRRGKERRGSVLRPRSDPAVAGLLLALVLRRFH